MSLADLSDWIRASLKWVAGGVGIIIILWVAWIVIAGVSSSIFKPRGADTQFGILDPPLFIKTHSVFSAKQIENVADLPKSKQKINVYQFQNNAKFPEDLLDDIILYFSIANGKKIEDKGLITIKRKTDNTFLKIDTSNSHFTYRNNVTKNTKILNSKIGLNEADALKMATESIKKLNLNLENAGINSKKPIITYIKLTGEGKSPANTRSANAVEIKFFRNIEKNLSTGVAPIRIMYGGGNKEIVEYDFYFSPLKEISAPYPVISASEALDLLKNGGGYTNTSTKFESAKITSISLRYWESNFFQPYLQPVWEFSAEAMFGNHKTTIEILVPAVNATYLAVPQDEQPLAPAPPVD